MPQAQQFQQQELQIVEEVNQQDDFFNNLDVMVAADINDGAEEVKAEEVKEEWGEAARVEADGHERQDEGGERGNIDPANESDKSSIFDEFNDEEIDRMMSTAHDLQSEIDATDKQKSERPPIGFPFASRRVFKTAKKVGIPVKFD